MGLGLDTGDRCSDYYGAKRSSAYVDNRRGSVPKVKHCIERRNRVECPTHPPPSSSEWLASIPLETACLCRIGSQLGRFEGPVSP